MPTVANNFPLANPGSNRCFSASFWQPSIRRQAPVRCVMTNVVVRQAALSAK